MTESVHEGSAQRLRRRDTTAPALLQPRATVGACWEAAGLWALVLLGGLALAWLMLLQLQRAEAQDLRTARLEITLQEVRERLEVDLALGFDLGDSGRAQELLEDTLGRDPSLLAVEVFEPGGISLFSTDRGSIGERVPLAWLDAIAQRRGLDTATQAQAPWRAGGAEPALGLPVRGPFGEVVGHVSLTPKPLPPPDAAEFLRFGLLLLVAVALLTGLRVAASLRARAAAGDSGLLAQVAGRLQATQQRLENILVRLVSDEGRH